MKTGKQKTIVLLVVLMTIFLVFFIAFFVFRNSLLQQAITKASLKMEQQYHSNLSVKKASFEGLLGVNLTEITLVPKNADTLFSIKKMKTSINVWHLFLGELQLGTLEIQNGLIQLVQKGNVKNFSAFLKKEDEQPARKDKRDYATFTYRVISKVLSLVPTDMRIENLSFKLDDNDKKATIDIKTLTLFDKEIETSINVQTNTFSQRWRIRGYADPRNKKADIQFFNIDTGAIKVPYFDERYNLKSSFDSIRLKISNIDKSGNELHIDGFTTVTNLRINHPKIASKDVLIKNARFDYKLLLGSSFISLDSSSTAQLNTIKFHPYMAYETKSDPIYKLKVSIPRMKAQDFISSLPDGLFSHLKEWKPKELLTTN
jgi:uncharacterized protein involved in outer membrane biogenesis